MGAGIARGVADDAVLLVCEEQGVCEDHILEGRRVLEQHGVRASLEFATGSPYKEIIRRSSAARILVIGSRPLDSLDPRFYLGDNATKVVRRMTTSTLVVKGRDQVRSILLCLDVPHSQATVNMARDIALAAGAVIEILHVASLPTLYSAEVPPPLDASVARDFLAEFYASEIDTLNEIRQELLGAGVGQVTVKLREGIVEEEIIRESVDGDFDLIVLKEGFFRTPFGLFLGRLSTNVATHSPRASVLIVKR
jgi:nucleotide-binding universal stress UspA family protein